MSDGLSPSWLGREVDPFSRAFTPLPGLLVAICRRLNGNGRALGQSALSGNHHGFAGLHACANGIEAALFWSELRHAALRHIVLNCKDDCFTTALDDGILRQQWHILPALELNLGSQVEDIGEAGEDVGQWEFWPWLAGIALLILALEWWVHHRGTRLPHISIR